MAAKINLYYIIIDYALLLIMHYYCYLIDKNLFIQKVVSFCTIMFVPSDKRSVQGATPFYQESFIDDFTYKLSTYVLNTICYLLTI